MWFTNSRKTYRTTRMPMPRPSFRAQLEVLEDRCLLSAGTLDATFGTNGIVTTNVGLPTVSEEGRAVAVYANAGTANDSKIVAAGFAVTRFHSGFPDNDFAVVRYNTNGTLDTAFGGSGKVTTDIGGQNNEAMDVKVQADGKVVAAGVSGADFAVVRYNADGSLDTAFGGKAKGEVITDINANSVDAGRAMGLQTDGKTVVAGWTTPKNRSGIFDLAVVRYNIDGSLDLSFGNTGKVTKHFASPLSTFYQAMDMAISNAGKIVVVGELDTSSSSAIVVVRSNTNGSLDSSFGNGTGYVTLNTVLSTLPSVAIQLDDRIVVAYYSGGISTRRDFGLARFNTGGSLDGTFGSGGIVVTPLPTDDLPRSVTIQPGDGKIVVAGNQGNNFMVARYNPQDGSLDTTFGVNGVAVSTGVAVDYLKVDVALQPDGRIVLAGSTTTIDFALARFLGDAGLTAAALPGVPVTQTLSLAEVAPLFAEAGARWQAAGAACTALLGIDVRIADLGAATLGLASGHTIWLDDNAAGWGWFVDPTPGDDSEFYRKGDQGEQTHMDLLTALEHELGHLLGFDHDDEGVMTETLTAGTRSAVSRGGDANTSRVAADARFALLAVDEETAWIGSSVLGRGRQKI